MKYDVIVVGSGSAGSIVATRISEDPSKSVLLIEAGPDYDEIEKLPDEVRYGYATGTDVMVSDHNWQFLGQPTPIAEPMMVPRGKVTGGSSAINGQMFLRGIPEDYDAWAGRGNDEWSYEKLLPYFRTLETDTDFSDDFHGTDGPIIVRRFKEADAHVGSAAFRTAALAMGHLESPDLNNPDSTGLSPTPLNNPNGIRWSTNLGYLSLSRHRMNLTIRANCDVQKVLFKDNTAVGLEVRSGGEIFTVEALECPTMLYNGYGEHNIQGIGDKHIPLIHNVLNTDGVVGISDQATDGLNLVFNTKIGKDYLRSDMGVDPIIVDQLKHFGFSSIANMLAAIKTAKSLDLGPEDVLISVATDGSELYTSEKEKLMAANYAGGFTRQHASEIVSRYLMGADTEHVEQLDAVARERIFNLGYYTWVEQQGVSIEDFEIRRSAAFWDALHKMAPVWDELIGEFNGRTGVGV